ncbi:MAG: hypothetical protein MUF71_02050 [Candidatus Kapabacteria bacterium]|nr:hypothetical protein [Candidatus Kapabacteria bacterium]
MLLNITGSIKDLRVTQLSSSVAQTFLSVPLTPTGVTTKGIGQSIAFSGLYASRINGTDKNVCATKHFSDSTIPNHKFRFSTPHLLFNRYEHRRTFS